MSNKKIEDYLAEKELRELRRQEALENKERNRNNTGLIIVWLIFFFPYGLYRLWKSDSKIWTKIFTTILFIFFGLMGSSMEENVDNTINSQKNIQPAEQIKVVEVVIVPESKYDMVMTSTEISEEYAQNEINFKENFLNKKVLFIGTVDKISQTSFGTAYFEFYEFNNITTYLDNSENERVLSIRDGDTVKLICEIKDIDGWIFKTIELKNCIFE